VLAKGAWLFLRRLLPRGDAAIRGGPDVVRSDGPLLEREDFSSIVISLYLFV